MARVGGHLDGLPAAPAVFGPCSAQASCYSSGTSKYTDGGSLALGVTFVIVVMVFRRGVLGRFFRLPSLGDWH